MAAIRNHAGNAPRLIFTAMEPSVSAMPASVNRLAGSSRVGMPSGYRELAARDRVAACGDTGEPFIGERLEKPPQRSGSTQGSGS